MKVSQLSGALLDYWVAKADGVEHAGYHFQDGAWHATDCGVPVFYSRSLEQGGAVIAREGIGVRTLAQLRTFRPGEHCWCASLLHGEYFSTGSTLLEAAMRCFVKSRFGEEVPDEVPT